VEHLAPKDILANLAPVRGGNSAGDGEIGGDVGIIVFANLIIDCCQSFTRIKCDENY
jgi:hypothetical protein